MKDLAADLPDLLIFMAFSSIPIEMLYFMLRFDAIRRLPRIQIAFVALFGTFTILCALTHLLHALDDMSASMRSLIIAVKIICAIVSIVTGIVMLWAIPATLRIPVKAAGLETELEKKVIELENARRRAEQADQSKGEFMAFLCHELRNPLHVITSNGEFLLDTRLDADQADFVKAIDSMSKLMTAIVNDVLDMSKLDSGRMSLENINIDLHFLIHTLIKTSEHTAKMKPVKFIEEIDTRSVPKHVLGDPTRLHQVLLNLLSNASKFTSQGLVKLSVVSRTVTQESSLVEFRVIDTGIGIPADFIPRLFSPYSQAKLSTVREHGGTGLGLSISKRIVEMMGGTI